MEHPYFDELEATYRHEVARAELSRRAHKCREVTGAQSLLQAPPHCPVCGRWVPIGDGTLVVYSGCSERLCGWCASWSLPLTVRA